MLKVPKGTSSPFVAEAVAFFGFEVTFPAEAIVAKIGWMGASSCGCPGSEAAYAWFFGCPYLGAGQADGGG